MKASLRQLIIDQVITEKGFASTELLMALTDSSLATLRRDIQFMKSLGAPIRHSRVNNGYYYCKPEENVGLLRNRSEPERKKQWFTSDELLTLVGAINAFDRLSKDRTSVLGMELRPVRARMLGLLAINELTAPLDLIRSVKVINDNEPHQEGAAFAVIGAALTLRRRVIIHYYTPSRREVTVREISPVRLVHYRNRWYVDAYCHMAEAMRTFLIENIRETELTTETIKRFNVTAKLHELDAGYGIFHGTDHQEAEIVFNRDFARYVLRETWHPDQRTVDEGETMRLFVPYTDSTELVGAILRWGADVEVVAPATLRARVAEEAQKIADRYAAKK